LQNNHSRRVAARISRTGEEDFDHFEHEPKHLCVGSKVTVFTNGQQKEKQGRASGSRTECTYDLWKVFLYLEESVNSMTQMRLLID
jgi:hypothetical protein